VIVITLGTTVVVGCALVWVGLGFGCVVELWGVGSEVGGRVLLVGLTVVGGGATDDGVTEVGGAVVVTTTGLGVVTKQQKKVWSAIDREGYWIEDQMNSVK
jgi:hypothetical protein